MRPEVTEVGVLRAQLEAGGDSILSVTKSGVQEKGLPRASGLDGCFGGLSGQSCFFGVFSVINLGVECQAVMTEVRSAGRCRLTRVRSAGRCMITDLFHLYHLPPDGRTTSVVADIGRDFGFSNSCPAYSDGSVPRDCLFDTCATRGVISGSARQNEWPEFICSGR